MLTIDEIAQRRLECTKEYVKNMILVDWYDLLSDVVRQKEDGRSEELDFSHNWLGSSTRGLLEILSEDPEFGMTDKGDDTFIRYVESLIGDQLKELGLEIRKVEKKFGDGIGQRIYFLKPGQEPSSMD